MTVVLSVDHVIAIHREYVCAGVLVDRGKLDGAVTAPFQAGFGVEFYPTIVQKAVKLVDAISRAQAFIDGNKRVAWLSMVTFPQLNGLALVEVPPEEAASWVLDLRGDEDGLASGVRWLNERLASLA